MFQGYCEKRVFIIAQSLLENTVRNFWKKVMDQRVPAIVMLCSMKEVGKVGLMGALLTSACNVEIFILTQEI